MIHFFGIFHPSATKREATDEAPGKAAFFGPDDEQNQEPAAVDGNDESDFKDSAVERQRFLLQSFSPQF